MQIGIAIPREEVARYCRKNRIRSLSLFGSVLRGDFREDSDIDILVEFEPGVSVGFIRMAAMERELSALLGGRKVDMRTAADLSPYFRDEVTRSAVVQYVAA